VHFVLARVSDWLRRRAFGFTPWCKNLFAKEHNNVAEIYQNSSFSCVGRLPGDGVFRQGRYCDWRGRAVHGSNATYGDQYWHGATQAAEDINAAGGINGEKIKLVQGDDACEPKQAVAVANRLVDQDKVNAVVGHFCSSSTMPASEVYSDAGIIAITPVQPTR
jgi:ABC-type branched-subunit amino acid transport system substrate-binding protein